MEPSATYVNIIVLAQVWYPNTTYCELRIKLDGVRYPD